MAQPVVSYPGAKWRFYPYMVEYFPLDMKTFIEPFFGGGSVSLSVADDPRFTQLERMVGGDLYTEMWAMWNGIKSNPQLVYETAVKWFRDACPHQKELQDTGFIAETARQFLEGGSSADFRTSGEFDENTIKETKELIKLYNTAIDEGKNFWNWAESVQTEAMTLEQRAARMLLVNKISFSGMGDSGSLSKDQFCNFKDEKLDIIFEAHKLLQRIEIYNVSFEETMKIGNESPNDSFIFLDPPYAKQESSGLYGKGGSTHKGFPHQHFADYTMQMKCKWFVTYDDSVIVRKLFSGRTIEGKKACIIPFTIPGGYTMAGNTAEDALAGEELFISNMDLKNASDDEELDF